MARLRERRLRQGRHFLEVHGRASALEIGTAAVKGEGKVLPVSARVGIGLPLGLHLLKIGVVRTDRFNRFVWVGSSTHAN